MNSKLTKVAFAIAFASTLAMAANVSNVQARQRWPWNGKVDIIYTLAADSPATANPVFAVSFKVWNGDTELTMDTVEGDGASGLAFNNGSHILTWDAATDAPDLVTASMVAGVTASDVTAQATYLKLNCATGKLTYQPFAPASYTSADKTSSIWFRRIEPQTFAMGSEIDEPGHCDDEEVHDVTLTRAFYVAVFELTQGQAEAIGYDTAIDDTMPLDSISYDDLRGTNYGATWPARVDHRVDSTSLIGTLRALTGNGLLFDLPTEAQWECACRAGHGSGYWNDGSEVQDPYAGDGDDDGGLEPVDPNFPGDMDFNSVKVSLKSASDAGSNLDRLAWYTDNSDCEIHAVGTKAPNSWGIYDMHGNMDEWCLDMYQEDITEMTTDPVGAGSGGTRVLRGGNWDDFYDCCRSAYRRVDYPSTNDNKIGARIVLIF